MGNRSVDRSVKGQRVQHPGQGGIKKEINSELRVILRLIHAEPILEGGRDEQLVDKRIPHPLNLLEAA